MAGDSIRRIVQTGKVCALTCMAGHWRALTSVDDSIASDLDTSDLVSSVLVTRFARSIVRFAAVCLTVGFIVLMNTQNAGAQNAAQRFPQRTAAPHRTAAQQRTAAAQRTQTPITNHVTTRGRADYESGDSSPELRKAALARLPMKRLTRAAQQRILKIAEKPTIYRRLPSQAIDCDQDMFLFLTRHPEVLVGIWDLMGITEVKIYRSGPYQLEASDGAGTDCTIDLVYGDPNIHLFVANGSYDGKLSPKKIRGSGVFMLTSRYAKSNDGRTTVMGTIDCFLQIESLGVDLIARTFSGLIGRAADNNFIETSRFVTQVSQASERNPRSMIDVAKRMPQVEKPTKARFQSVIHDVADRAAARYAAKSAVSR